MPVELDAHPPPMLADVNGGTISVQMGRFVVDLARELGISPEKYHQVLGLDRETLADDLSRVPTTSGTRLWRLFAEEATRGDLAARVVGEAGPGRLGVWDHLFTSGRTLVDGARDAARYLPAVSDPDVDSMEVVEDGRQVTLRYSTQSEDLEAAQAVQEFAIGLFRRRLCEAKRQPLVPVQVRLTGDAPLRHGHLIELFGTRRIEFGAEEASITFLAADFDQPLPDHRPGLSELLRRHADLTMALAKPVLAWPDLFRAALGAAFEEETLSLAAVAHRLLVSPRTLQRRLEEHGTTWSEEVEAVRREHAMRLLQETDLGMASIAARVGYADVRVLRRAVQRWYGHSPSSLRKSLAGTS